MTHQTVLNFSALSCFYLLHPVQVFFSLLLSILSLLFCSGRTSLSLTVSSLLQVCAVLALFFSPLYCVSSPLVPLYSAVLSLSLLCHHLLCRALNNFASPSPTALCLHPLHCALTYSAVPSPSLLRLHPLYSAPTYVTLLSPPPTLCALTYSTLLYSYLVLLSALT